MNIAILIAIEKYNDTNIPRIPFADVNAEALSSTLEPLDFSQDDQIKLVTAQATKTSIESKIRRAFKSCLEDDKVLMYYSGHIYSENGANFLTCADTDASDLRGTTIPLQWLLKQIQESDCQQVVLLVDSSESDCLPAFDKLGLYDTANEQEFKKFFGASDKCVCLAACQPGQGSHVSRKWKQGIWVRHLLEAFEGKIPLPKQNGDRLTCSVLSSYLQRSVPQTLTTHYSSKSTQQPVHYAAHPDEFVIVDLSNVMSKRRKPNSPYADLVNCTTFFSNRSSTVKSLSGFKKGNAVPDRANIAAQTFVAQLAQEQITEDLKTNFAALKTAFKFKRADVTVTDQGDGTGTITTPFFNYSISVEVDATNPACVIWRRSVDAIKEPDQVFSDKFAAVFGSAFDSVEFSTMTNIDINALIDSVEALEDERIVIEYDPDGTECVLSIQGITGAIHVSKRAMRIVHDRTETPSYLLRSFFAIQKSLMDSDGQSLISIGSQNR